MTPKVPAAIWYEREVRDMFGLQPVGLPDERRLVLPDDWPDDLYPLRKDTMDYRYRPEPTTEKETYDFIHVEGEGIVQVPLGPLHITSDEPGHFRLYVDGEHIVDADYRLFYVHRGMEKLAETRLNYDQVTFLADRICGICGYAHNVAYSTSIERALGIEVPERAQFIRTILLEVERLHSHLLNLGLACHFVGFDTGFMQFFRVREKAMKMAELLTGSRKTYGMNLIGGVRRDILKEQRTLTLQLLAELRDEVHRPGQHAAGYPQHRPAHAEHRPAGTPDRARLQPCRANFERLRLCAGYPRNPSLLRLRPGAVEHDLQGRL